jgi:hypothetical protein
MIPEKLQQCLERLPVSLQAEVLDFVEYLLAKAERRSAQEDDKAWSQLSLNAAMRGMENETEPAYTDADLIETF